MSPSPRTRLHRAALTGLLCLSVFTVACSDDSGDDDAATDTSEAGSDAWCEAIRSSQNAVPSDMVRLTEEAAAVAPEELADDYEVFLELVEYRASNPADTIGIMDRGETAAQPFANIVAAAKEECDIEVNMLG